jgi:DNA (cytosine-5)-methyltransferase 1
MADGRGDILLPKKLKRVRAADLFCGAGGTSTGALRAARELGMKLELTAVNHWDTAIETHTRNHPDAKHMCADLEHVRPIQAVPGGVLDILMASPTCTYYSRARGGKPVHDQQRMDPWHVVRWCTDLRVHRLLVENVPEMMDWGPCDVRTGRPIASRKGEYFRAWIEALKGIGMRVDYRVICCADHGDPTTRERFFLIGRSDGRRLRWPEPTHAKGGAVDLLGVRERWRSAKEDVIDWSIQGKSIFNRKRPLKPNTIRRILAGAKRYGWPAPHVAALQALLDGNEPVLDVPASEASPFLIQFRGTNAEQIAGGARATEEPIGTVSAGGTHQALVMATGASGAARVVGDPIPSTTTTATPHFIEPLVVHRSGREGRSDTARSADDPIYTATTAGAGYLAEPLLMGIGSSNAAKPVTEPTPTITPGGATCEHRPGNARPQLIEPLIVSKHGGPHNTARKSDDPLWTVSTAGGGAIAEPLLMRAGHGGDALKNPGAHVMKPEAPLPTQTGGAEFSVAQPLLAPYYGSGSGETSKPTTEPMPAVTTKARFGVVEPFITSTRQSKEGAGPRPRSVAEPLPTLVATDSRFGVVEPMLLRTSHGDSDGRDPAGRVLDSSEPLPAQTGSNEFGTAQAIVLPVTHKGDARVHGVDEPVRTVTGANRGEFGVSQPIIMRGNVGEGRLGDMRSAEEPAPTVTCSESLALSAPFLMPNFGEREGQEPRTHDVDAPLPTVAATGHIQLAEPAFDPATQTYRIDILYRMLHWRELARAMSFDDEGEVYDFAGNATEITKQIGNAVPGRTAKALIKALLEG